MESTSTPAYSWTNPEASQVNIARSTFRGTVNMIQTEISNTLKNAISSQATWDFQFTARWGAFLECAFAMIVVGLKPIG